MQKIEDPNKMQELAIRLRSEGKLIALVPTSGCLHAGHRAMIERAKKEADVVVVSAIVNPREFGPNEDYKRYPRNSAADRDFCEEAQVNFLFCPSAKTLYPEGFSISVQEDSVSAGLCGISRPHYFKGVCTLHMLLFNLVRPDHLVLGRRDAQKCVVLQKLIDELHFPITLLIEEAVRDENGLVLNARNQYLNEFQRRDALTVYRALLEGKKLVDAGIVNVDRIIAEVTHHISQVRRLRVIYVAAVDPDTMEPVRTEIVHGKTLIMVAVWCDEVRLIDNMLL